MTKRKTNGKIFGHEVWTDSALTEGEFYFQNPPIEKHTGSPIDLCKPIIAMSDLDFEKYKRCDNGRNE